MTSRKGGRREKGSKIPKMLNLESTGLRRSDRLNNKPRKKGLFDELSLEVVGSCEVDKNLPIFII